MQDIPDDADNMAIARAIIALGSSLNKLVIAEGVETLEQALFLQQMSCQQAQGYYYSKPLRAEEMEGYLSSRLYTANVKL